MTMVKKAGIPSDISSKLTPLTAVNMKSPTTIKTGAVASDLNRPGHVFPLRGRNGGVLTRRGHTEGSIDLARLAGLKPAGVLCEVTNPDGSMASGIQVLSYAQTHDLTLITIEELVQYRVQHNV